MRVEWHDSAIADLERLKDFILPHNKEAAKRAVRIIKAAVTRLAANPRIGKTVDDLPYYHDVAIPFGASGYLLRYRFLSDSILIIALKHGKEAGFSDQAAALWVVKESVEEAYGIVELEM